MFRPDPMIIPSLLLCFFLTTRKHIVNRANEAITPATATAIATKSKFLPGLSPLGLSILSILQSLKATQNERKQKQKMRLVKLRTLSMTQKKRKVVKTFYISVKELFSILCWIESGIVRLSFGFPLKFLQMKKDRIFQEHNQKKKKKKQRGQDPIRETHMSVNIFISARKYGISPDKSFFDKSLFIVEYLFLGTKKKVFGELLYRIIKFICSI